MLCAGDPVLEEGKQQGADSGPGMPLCLGQLLLSKVLGQTAETRGGFSEEVTHELASERPRGVSQLER